ncbi:HNH endonuclease [Streptomyces sp. HU2014]|nr:HNH endonuclease signature motif containing protein [Streptomyces sp. HU2014]UQI49426.1 HNH endonuclease [Streptomyces sp. HU2014]
MTRCIDCSEPATHRGRCERHHQVHESRPAVRVRRARGRRRAVRYDGAARLRRLVQERGHAWCDWCLDTFPADQVDVDHVRPLARGGADTDGNVQVLCRGCHGLKTGTEFGMPGCPYGPQTPPPCPVPGCPELTRGRRCGLLIRGDAARSGS